MLHTLMLTSLLAAANPSGHGDLTTLTVLAEIALERGDCKAAAESYAEAAPSGDAQLTRRGSEVALACEHLPAAWQSVQRWRALAPQDPVAATTYATIALKLYRIADAQAAMRTVAAGADSEAHLAELTAKLLNEAEAPEVLTALAGAIQTERASPALLTLLAGLALESHDLKRAEHYAQLALRKDSPSFETLSLSAQIYAERGDRLNATAAALAATRADPKRGACELAEVLTTLNQPDAARRELERLRAAGAAPAVETDRRLALLALQSGDLAQARRLFSELKGRDDIGETAQLYLADIAARQGNEEEALSGYRALADSSVALTARVRAAQLLFGRGRRAEALGLLDDYVAVHPESGFEMTLTKAQLLSEYGEVDFGLALLDSALARHPDHPALEYNRAVLLEKKGKVRESVELLERMIAERPEDVTLLNALGYTLADHGMRLAHAEGLIRKALIVTPDNPAVLDSLGWVRFKRGDARGAAVLLERAYTLDRDDEIAAHWGEALWKSGSRKQARQVWGAALAREPDSKPLQTMIGRFMPLGKS